MSNSFRLLFAIVACVLSLAFGCRTAKAQCPGGVCPSPSQAYAAPSWPSPSYSPASPYGGYYQQPAFFFEVPTFYAPVGVMEIREYCVPPVGYGIAGGYAAPQYQSPLTTGYGGYAPHYRGRVAIRQRIR